MKNRLAVILILTLLALLIPKAMPVAASIDTNPILIGRWHLDNNVDDSSTNNNDGTLFGAAYDTGIYEEALKLDGIDDYFQISNSPSLNPEEITVEVWFNAASGTLPNQKSLVQKPYTSHVSPYYQYALFLMDMPNYPKTASFRISLENSSTMYYINAHNLAFDYGEWHHLAGTYDGQTMKLYLDGQLVASSLLNGKIAAYNTPLQIGAYPNLAKNSTYCFGGMIDEVRIWGSALTAEQLNDMEPPEIAINIPDGTTYLLNEIVNADWSVTDNTGTGVKSESATVPSGSPIVTDTIGNHSFAITAEDYAGNTNEEIVNYVVAYGFNGLFSPYAPPDEKVFKVGRSIPLKWQYTDADGIVMDSIGINPIVKCQYVAEGNGEGELVEANATGSSGYQYDPVTMTWQFNWQTKGLASGINKIIILPGPPKSQFLIELK